VNEDCLHLQRNCLVWNSHQSILIKHS